MMKYNAAKKENEKNTAHLKMEKTKKNKKIRQIFTRIPVVSNTSNHSMHLCRC